MTAPSAPLLTKSRFLAGLQCPRRLWLSEYELLPYQEPDPGSPQAVEGIAAHLLRTGHHGDGGDASGVDGPGRFSK